MGGFFDGKRRTIGIATLAIALLLMGAWGRSQKYVESGTIRLSENRLLAGCSNRGSLRLITLQIIGEWPSDAEFPTGTVKWERATVVSNAPKVMENPFEIFHPIFRNCNDLNLNVKSSDWEIPYLPAILFMTFVSSFLLLVNPRLISRQLHPNNRLD